MYRGPRNHVFLYHAYALALGGWVRDKDHQFTAIPALAPSVLSITGGYASACEKRVNFSVPGKYQFGKRGPSSFHLYVGNAFSEVRGTVEDDKRPFGAYTTMVRSVLDDVRINDDLYIEHSEASLTSTHDNPGNDTPGVEPEVVVGASNMAGVHVRGTKATLARHREVGNLPIYDHVPTFGALQARVEPHLLEAATAGKGGATSDPDLDELCDWHDPNRLPDGTPDYARDLAAMNQNAKEHFRFSIFKGLELENETPGVQSFRSSVEIDDFGRVFFGEVIASHGTKQVTMFRIDLGCDNCGGVGGSGGTTNGSSYPP